MTLQEALKYQQRERLSVAQIHPSLRYTRLGAVLREQATAPDDIGALAHQALVADHSQPLDLMPLHLLRDKMLEQPNHPLANSRLNWETLPERVALDEHLRKAVSDWNNSPESGKGTVEYGDGRLLFHHLQSNRPQPDRRVAGIRKVLTEAHENYPGLSVNDVQDSIKRLQTQDHLRWFAEGSEDAPLSAEERSDPEEVHNRLGRSTSIGHPSETYR